MPEPAYQFIGLLDGRRTVDEAWELCGGQLGDAAPTQGEAIQLLGQLYTANLLQAELPAQAQVLVVGAGSVIAVKIVLKLALLV